jgi:hypothetical protein
MRKSRSIPECQPRLPLRIFSMPFTVMFSVFNTFNRMTRSRATLPMRE